MYFIKLTIVLCLFTTCFFSESLAEEIFGLKKGMSIDEIRALDFGDVKQSQDSPEAWFVIEPKKPKDTRFAHFYITPEDGLLKIMFTWHIQTNSYGYNAKEKFNELRDILKKKYGEGKTIDYLNYGSLWDEPRYWMMGLLKGDRRLVWIQSDFADSNKWNLSTVGLRVEAINQEKASLALNYEYQGFSEYLDGKKAEEASQF